MIFSDKSVIVIKQVKQKRGLKVSEVKIDFSNLKKVHFIGVGGISMSALAEATIAKNIKVSGSDRTPSDITRRLENLGANIVYEQRGENITEDTDLVVYTAGISDGGAFDELNRAKEQGIKTMVRGEYLGAVMSEYENAVCVAGTHGKTTTTSMMAHILMEAEPDPTIMVGGILHSIGGNARIGKEGTFLTEACEYKNSYHSMNPTVGIVLNVCADHLDFFEGLDDIRKSFRTFIEKIPDKGALVINGDIDNVEFFTENLGCKVIKAGMDKTKNNICAANLKINDSACYSYDLMVDGENRGRVELSVIGIHNVYNSLAAIGASLFLGISVEDIIAGLKKYGGTDRRFQKKGTFNGVTVIDDYAHHPDEIRATLEAAKNYPHKKLWVVFQPHTYSRTKALLKEFGESLSMADYVVLADIYAAREYDTLGISSEDVVNEIKKHGTDSCFINSFEEIEKYFLRNCKEGDLLITMGAGNVVEIGDSLVK